MRRASLMGVDIPSDNFDKIDLLKELESSRKILVENQSVPEKLFVDHKSGYNTPLSLTWHDSVEVEESFMVVQSRKSKKDYKRKNISVSRPLTRSQCSAAASSLPPGRSGKTRTLADRYK